MERYRTTIIMVVVLVVLGGLAIFLNGRGGPTTAVPTTEPVTYVWQDTNPVIGMDVVSSTSKVSLTKNISTTIWSLTTPIKAVADPSVDSVASSLESLQATNAVTDSSNVAQFGLDKAGMSVTATFSDTAHTKRTLQVGGPTFDGSGYYVKTQDAGKVYVVSNSTLEPMRSWLASPPKELPTATPLPITVVPTSPITGTGTVTNTTLPLLSGETPRPTGGAATTTITGTATSTGTSAITGTNSVTVTLPGAANPTTPLASPPLATPSTLPSATP